MPTRPRLAVFKFASCDGCQLQVIDVLGRGGQHLGAVADTLDIEHFLEARSRIGVGPYDVGLVEGSVSTPQDVERIKEIRGQCRVLVTIGACATAGGIQALRNWSHVDDFVNAVYATPSYIETLEKSTPIADHVKVDFELRGCPIDPGQLASVLAAAVSGRKPKLPGYSVCVECKQRGTVCVAVTKGIACLGPVTQAGCGGLCPAYDRECFGCFGPSQQPNLVSLTGFYERHGAPREQLGRLVQSFNAWAPEFRAAHDRLAGHPDGHPKGHTAGQLDDQAAGGPG
jgi:coenzyme F420-reducing hydrogenase gamma subunit